MKASIAIVDCDRKIKLFIEWNLFLVDYLFYCFDALSLLWMLISLPAVTISRL